MRYQVIYSFNNKTQYIELESNNVESILTLFKKLIVGELLEIREIQYSSNAEKKDNKDYIHSASVKVYNNSLKLGYSFKIPKLSNIITEDNLKSLTLSTIKIQGLKPDTVKISNTFKY